MATQKDLIEVIGTITDILPNQMFKVKLDDQDHTVICYSSGKMRKFNIRIVLGDKVKLEISPYDLSKGRISLRL